jgi:hypothetical protein
LDAVEKATHEAEASLPTASPPLPDPRAVIAALVRTFSRFRSWPFADQRSTLKRVVHSIRVVDAAIPECTISGAFLGELSHSNSAQRRSRALCSFSVPPDIVLALPEPIPLRA